MPCVVAESCQGHCPPRAPALGWVRAGSQLREVCQDLLEGGADANGNWLTNLPPSQLRERFRACECKSKTKMMSQQSQQDEC